MLLAACNFGSVTDRYRLNGTTEAVSLLPSNLMTVQAVNLSQFQSDGVAWTMAADYAPTRLSPALYRGSTCPGTVHICVHANSYPREERDEEAAGALDDVPDPRDQWSSKDQFIDCVRTG